MSSSSHLPQPPQSATYIQPSNPTSSNPSEAAQSQKLHPNAPSLLNSSTATTESTTRTVGDINSSRDDAGSGGGLPTALARGVRGSESDREREVEKPNPTSSYSDQPHSPNSDPDNQKMRVLAEGDVSATQRHKVGFGEEEDLAADLERKKEEQEIVKKERRGGKEDQGEEVDVRAAIEGEGKGTVIV